MSAENPLHAPFPTAAADRRRWGQLHGSAGALSIASTAERHQSLTLVITASSAIAAELEAELEFFLASQDQTASLPLLQLPDWETLPYDYFSPHEDIISERLRTLYQLPLTSRGILIVPVTTILHRMCPPSYLQHNSLVLETGQGLDPTAMSRRLEAAGYRHVETVYEHGEYAVRGSLLDVYPMGSPLPFRIDLFDNEIESLRTFDPDSQRTREQIDAIQLLPAREFPLDKEGIARFRDKWHESFDVDHRACPLYQEVSAGAAPAGIEYYLPLFLTKWRHFSIICRKNL